MSAKENLTSCLQRSVYMRPQDLLDYGPRHCAPVAQLDRATASGAVGHRFEPCRAHQSPSQHGRLLTSDFPCVSCDPLEVHAFRLLERRPQITSLFESRWRGFDRESGAIEPRVDLLPA